MFIIRYRERSEAISKNIFGGTVLEKFAIVTDAFCELNADIRNSYGIDFIPGHYIDADENQGVLNLDWNPWSKNEFYSKISKNIDFIKTSPANVEELAQKFEIYAKNGVGILCFSISTAISGTYNFSLLAKKQVQDKYPNAQIEIIDSRRYGHGHGLMCIHASEMRSQGKSLSEIYEYFKNNFNNYHQGGWLDDLSFVAKKGRISNSKAFFGQLVGIKPIGDFDDNGLTTILGNVKGEKTAYKICLEYIKNTILDAENQTIIIGYTQREKQAQNFKTMVEEFIHPKKIIMCDVFYGCGINVGPGLMSAYYAGKPISKGLEEEKKLLANLLEQNKK